MCLKHPTEKNPMHLPLGKYSNNCFYTALVLKPMVKNNRLLLEKTKREEQDLTPGRYFHKTDRNSSSLLLNSTPLVQIRTKLDRKSTRLNSSHVRISYAVFCLK